MMKRANRPAFGKKFCHVQAGAGVGGCARLGIQVVIKRDQCRGGKEGLAFGDHRRRIPPDFQLKAVAQFARRRLKSSNALVVVFQDENGFHIA